MSMSMPCVHLYAACPCPCCMSMSMLHVHIRVACPCPCCMPMSVLHVHVNVNSAFPCPCPGYMSTSMSMPLVCVRVFVCACGCDCVCINAELSVIRSVQYRNEKKTNNDGTGLIQTKLTQFDTFLIWYQTEIINADAGFGLLDANAQLCGQVTFIQNCVTLLLLLVKKLSYFYSVAHFPVKGSVTVTSYCYL
jgi:hypothetical protein